jgi:hypothetical protein
MIWFGSYSGTTVAVGEADVSVVDEAETLGAASSTGTTDPDGAGDASGVTAASGVTGALQAAINTNAVVAACFAREATKTSRLVFSV